MQAAIAACDPVPSAQIDSLLSVAEQAYIDLDSEGFQQASGDVAERLPCLSNAATPSLAARYGRVASIRAFADGNAPAADASIRAVRVLEPQYRFPDDLLAPQHELRRAHELANAEEGELHRLMRPTAGELLFDGRPSVDRPVARATLFQHVDDAGAVVTTSWLLPADPVPAYPHAPLRRAPVLVTAASTAVAAGALYGLALASSASFHNPDSGLDRDALIGLQKRTNLLTVSSLGVAGLAVGVGVVGIAFGG